PIDEEMREAVKTAADAWTELKAARDDAGGAAASPLVPPEPPEPAPSENSWRVELTTEDGERLVNWLRFKTKTEAALYASRQAEDLLSPLWRPVLRKAGHKPLIVVMTCVLASGDVPNCKMKLPKERLGAANIDIPDGGCSLYRWRPEGDADEP